MDNNDIMKKLQQGDQAHSKDIILNGNKSAQDLEGNAHFINVMKLIFEITGFDVVDSTVDKNRLLHHNGKRDVWSQIRELCCFSPHILSIIEHHKQINRNERGLK